MLVLLGINHESAPLTMRERLAFSEQDLAPALRRLLARDGIQEAMILSTCNRVEVLARAADTTAAARAITTFLAEERRVPVDELDGHAYLRSDEAAVRHVFEVACGLDSMILGEPQILGQIKQAYSIARDSGSTGPLLDHLLQAGFSAAKQVRSETGISRNAVSVAFAAVELARKIFGDLKGRAVLVVGAGKMAALATRHLVASGIDRISVASRSLERGEAFARTFGGKAVPWDRAWDLLDEVDVVVTGTAAPGTILDRDRVAKAARARRSRPLFIIDIAVPRDVDPAVNELDNVYLYDVDDLQGIVEDNIGDRRRAAVEARRMIDSHVRTFRRWHASLNVTPTIVALRESLLGMGRQEVERFRRRLGDMTPSQAQAVDELTRAIIHKVLHRPIRQLKEFSDRGDAQMYTALYREIFGIESRGSNGDGGTATAADEPAPADDREGS
jgi:glutamyl-tRNA reductase